ncbi:MAG: hypothetical protein A3E82_07580 [Gammaproteobacteria bacterium RIFCSPHIGHO2_12_FULL_38_11]|nr:MAG: hypothetical protein A3E82_07580 [Gammaproteobacteria bacterium RIFCSPHIGHO2_12_FULL_38_11]
MKLPSWLYYAARTSESISPAAVFDPCAAFEDQPWTSSAAPSSQQCPKTIVVAYPSLVEFSSGILIAVFNFLEREGFNIHHLEADRHFNPETDYKKITEKMGVSRDHMVVLDSMRMRELLTCLQSPQFKRVYGFHNAFKFSIFENSAKPFDAHQMVCQPVDGLTVNGDEIVLLFNKILKENNIPFFIYSFSDLKSNTAMIMAIHALFLKNDAYREFILAIKANSVKSVINRDFFEKAVHCLIALLLPELRQYLTMDMLYNFSDENEILEKFILSDDELRSRLSISHIRNILSENEALQKYYEIVHYTDDIFSHPVLLEIHELDRKTVANIEMAAHEGLLDLTKIKSLRLIFPTYIEDEDELFRFDIEFNMLYDYILQNLTNLKHIEVPDVYAFAFERLEEFSNITIESNTKSRMYQPDIKSNILYIHNQAVRNHQVSSEGSLATQHYTMVEGGEVLSKDFSLPRVRTVRVSYEYVFQQLHKIVVKPVKITPVRCYFADNNWLDYLRTLNNDYYYVKFSQTLSLGYTRLLSIHANETIAGLVTHDGQIIPGLSIVQGDDGFYHACSTLSMSITFVVAVEKKYYFDDAYKQLSIDDPIQKIIDEYCQTSLGYSRIADPNKCVPKLAEAVDYKAWCEQLFQQRAGVCWHRALSVSEKIKTLLPNEAYRVEIVTIDNNHEALEILNYGNYILIDLGGGVNVTLSYQQLPVSKLAGVDDLSGVSDNPAIPKSELNNASEIIKTNKLAPFLMESILPHFCDAIADFFEIIENNQYSKILLRVDSTEKTANFLLRKYSKNNNIFYVDTVKLLAAQKEDVVIDQHQQPRYTNVTPLELFLRKSAEEIGARYFLLIDVRQTVLDAKTLVSMSTLFYSGARKICGCDVSDNVCVVAITDQMPDDSAFLSRQDIVLNLSPDLISNDVNYEKSDTFTVDLCGTSDWKKTLFGPVVLNNNKMHWLESEFSRRCNLFPPGIEIMITGFRKEDQQEMKIFFEKSKSLGFFDYRGYRLFIPDGMTFNFNGHYDFSCFASQSITINATTDNLNENHYEINTDTFDLLLHDKVVSGGVYNQKPGLLEMHSQKTLHLFITSQLSNCQWWILFSMAEKNNIQLMLMLAPNINLPETLACEKVEAICHEFSTQDDCVFITNNISAAAAEIFSGNDSDFDVEDYSFQDLFHAIFFEKNKGEFSDFSICKSDVLLRLIKGDTIILKGEFSNDLLSYMKTLLLPNPYLWINGEKIMISGKLILIIEDKKLTPDSISSYDNFFDFLDNISIWTYPNPPKSTPIIIDEPDYSSYPSLEKEDSIAFIEARIKRLFDALQDNALLQLISEAGKGKSRLIQLIENSFPDTVTIYREMDNFEKYANDHFDKIKILFIDESNIDDFHYTMFSPLKRGGSRQILYRRKIYLLDENHKVVFARNPNEYGAGRMAQKLFEDGSIPEYYFSDFSPAYIYHELLKPIFDLANLKVSEADFKNDCHVFIESYFTRQNKTVRQLQQTVLSYCLAQKKNDSLFQTSLYCGFFTKKENDDRRFVLTESSIAVRASLESFIQIKKLQAHVKLPAGIGSNGVFISGEPGVGKTALAAYMFKKYCIDFITIDASLMPEVREALSLKAFHAGYALFADRMNCYSDGRWAKFINKLLTGEDPLTGEPPRKQGFFLLATGYDAHHVGCSVIDPALLSRCLKLALPKPTKSDIKNIVLNEADDFDVDALADDFDALQQISDQVTLHGLLRALPAVSLAYQNELRQACS